MADCAYYSRHSSLCRYAALTDRLSPCDSQFTIKYFSSTHKKAERNI